MTDNVTPLPRPINAIVADIDAANQPAEINTAEWNNRQSALASLAVELADAVRRDTAADEIAEVPEQVWRGNTGIGVVQYLATITGRDGEPIIDKATAREAVSMVFNLAMADVDPFDLLEPGRWAVPLPTRAVKEFKGRPLDARDMSTGYRIKVDKVS